MELKQKMKTKKEKQINGWEEEIKELKYDRIIMHEIIIKLLNDVNWCTSKEEEKMLGYIAWTKDEIKHREHAKELYDALNC